MQNRMPKTAMLTLLSLFTGILFLKSAVSFAQAVSFEPAINFSVVPFPNSVAVGDFNGDGKLDLAVAGVVSSGNARVSVLMGVGDGTFGAAGGFTVGGDPAYVAAGDFNADGKLDLAVVSTFGASGFVLMRLGAGDGTFTAAGNFAVGFLPSSLVVGDFNGDGKLDLVVANRGSNNVSVLLGVGNGSFGLATNFTVGVHPSSVAVGDFNGDGKLDLAVANNASHDISIRLGVGNGTFGPATNFAAGNVPPTELPFSVSVGDFNGDGKSDLTVTNWYSSIISVFLGLGDGTFGGAMDFALRDGDGPEAVVVADFNGDQKLDLAVAKSGRPNVSILAGAGDGTFGGFTNFAVGSTSYSVAAGDFNGDGKLDLAVANYFDSSVSILVNNTDPNRFLVNCPADSLQATVNGAFPGQTFTIMGTCSENILIRNDKVRLFLKGGGTATINAPDSTRAALDVRGKAISIQGLTITGGSSGIEVQRGANAVIDSNVIDSTGGHGVIVNQLAFAVLTNNTIQNNAGDGIVVKEGAAARIGFNTGTEAVPIGNSIQMNSGNGVTAAGSSSARVVGNSIHNNGVDGVEVMSGAQADISNNFISGNGDDGIHVTANSSVQLGEDPGLFAQANSGTGNAGFGIGCDFGGALDGVIGALTGNMGATDIDTSCPNSLSP